MDATGVGRGGGVGFGLEGGPGELEVETAGVYA